MNKHEPLIEAPPSAGSEPISPIPPPFEEVVNRFCAELADIRARLVRLVEYRSASWSLSPRTRL